MCVCVYWLVVAGYISLENNHPKAPVGLECVDVMMTRTSEFSFRTNCRLPPTSCLSFPEETERWRRNQSAQRTCTTKTHLQQWRHDVFVRGGRGEGVSLLTSLPDGVGESEEGHRHNQIERPVGRSWERSSETSRPQWIYLGVDSPRHRSHSYASQTRYMRWSEWHQHDRCFVLCKHKHTRREADEIEKKTQKS